MIRERLFGSPTGVSLGLATFTNAIGASWFQLWGQTALKSARRPPGSYGVPFLSSQATIANAGAELLVTVQDANIGNKPGTSAIGFRYGSYIGLGWPSIGHVEHRRYFSSRYSAPKTAAAFIGFTSPTSITSILFVDAQTSNGVIDLTNFTVGSHWAGFPSQAIAYCLSEAVTCH
jgi:hypothetical protein